MNFLPYSRFLIAVAALSFLALASACSGPSADSSDEDGEADGEADGEEDGEADGEEDGDGDTEGTADGQTDGEDTVDLGVFEWTKDGMRVETTADYSFVTDFMFFLDGYAAVSIHSANGGPEQAELAILMDLPVVDERVPAGTYQCNFSNDGSVTMGYATPTENAQALGFIESSGETEGSCTVVLTNDVVDGGRFEGTFEASLVGVNGAPDVVLTGGLFNVLDPATP